MKLYWIIIILVTVSAIAGNIDPHAKAVMYHPAFRSEAGLQSAFVRDNFSYGGGNIDVLVAHRPDWLPPSEARIYMDRFGIATLNIPISRLHSLTENPAVYWIEASSRCYPNLDVSVPETGAPMIWSAPSGGDGEGVLVGILDTGIDWAHPDFSDPIEGNRIIAIWDQTVEGPVTPDEFGYGMLWNEFDISTGACTEEDFYGHGTHVTGEAAGNHPVFTGMAPGADILQVKGGNSGFWGHDIANGIIWMADFAAERSRPIAMNMSLGGGYGPHDGTLLYERIIGSVTGPGRIVCISAGNSRNAGTHYQLDVTPASADSVVLSVSSSSSSGPYNDYIFISGWYDGEDSMDVFIIPPLGGPLGPIGTGDSVFISDGGNGMVWIDNAFGGPAYNGDNCFTLMLVDANPDYPPAAGDWVIKFEGGGTVHGWLYSASIGSEILEDYRVATHLVGPPGTTPEALTVASYATKNRWVNLSGDTVEVGWIDVDKLSSFSSPGPTRIGAQKPDIAAPGQVIAAALSSSSVQSGWWTTLDGEHVLFQGTSMSCPHACGAAALLLQADPALTPDRFKQLLNSTATVDSFVGTAPNYDWGGGKMNIGAAFSALVPENAIPLLDRETAAGTLSVSENELYIASISEGVVAIQVEVAVSSGSGDVKIRYGEPPTTSEYDTSEILSIGTALIMLDDFGSAPPEPGDMYILVENSSGSLDYELELTYIYDWGTNRVISAMQTAHDTIVAAFMRTPDSGTDNPSHWTITADEDTIPITDIDLSGDEIAFSLGAVLPEGSIVRLHYRNLPGFYECGWKRVETFWPIINGSYYQHLVWADTTYPYYIDNCRIRSSGSLTIMPGVEVVGLFSFSQIMIDGAIEAIGTSERPIEFSSRFESGKWAGIEINGRRFPHRIENAKIYNTQTAFELNWTSVTLSNLDIRNTSCGVKLDYGSDLDAGGIVFASINDPDVEPTELAGVWAVDGSDIEINNCTFDSIYYAGVLVDSVENLDINNAIFTRCGSGVELADPMPNEVTYSCFWDNSVDTWGPVILGAGIIYDNPLFIGGDPFDYHLSPGSPCIDTGEPAIFDADSTRSDMGAYGGNYGTNITVFSNKPEDIDIKIMPNPFNASCRISASKASEIDIFDISGRLVRSYRNQTDGKIESVIWDGLDNSGRKLPVGIYLIKSQHPTGGKTAKAILIK